MSAEVWKDIPGYEGAYQVSSLGRVMSIRGQYAGRILSQYLQEGRYYKVVLYLDGKEKNYLTHRLVALAFLGPCPEGEEVRHLDGDSKNNAVENLAYGTHKENEEDKLQHGTVPWALTEEQVEEIRKRLLSGETNISICKDYGVSNVVISNIRRGKSYFYMTGDLATAVCNLPKWHRLTKSDAEEIRKLLRSGMSRADAAELFGVSTNAIGRIARGESFL